MWFIYALGSAFFAGITAILAKIGIENTDSHLVTALRTTVIIFFSWTIVFIVGSQEQIREIESKTLVFLILSGLCTGAAWMSYFKALQLGDVNKVVPIDKSSTILTMILAFIILKEPITIYMLIGLIGIAIGTYMMIQKQKTSQRTSSKTGWLLYAVLSAFFSSMTAILGKIGIEGVESNLGMAIRTVVVFFMAWIMVFITKKQKEIKNINKKSWIFILCSGVTTGLSWLFYYRALKDGPASVVVPIDKMSILVSIGFAYFILKEKITKKAAIGLVSITIGTLILAL
ncbi:MAG TPA: EamA family transporter [Candidatus Merdenecus merdavium]|nr:EamA family transporter [Candidatus Merdenecus merdavium]